MTPELQRKLVVEFLGMFIFVFTVGMATSATGAGVLAPLAIGAVLMVMVFAGGHVSGGHFNPAVTLAALFDGRVDWLNAIFYVVAQVVGATVAALAINLLIGQGAIIAAVNQPAVPEGQAFAVEALLTAIFVAVILSVTKRQPAAAPLVIALTLLMIHFAAIPISGASVNPARSLGPAIVGSDYNALWVYLTGPFVGGILGWGVYRFFVTDEELVEVEVEEDGELEDGLEGEGEPEDLPGA